MNSDDFTSFSREERKRAHDMRDLVIRYADARDAVGNAAIRIWQAGNEINHDTLMECLNDRLALSRTIGDENSQAYLQLAISTLKFNRGRL
ncbi:hypothetical protein JK231_23120 [Pantoea sp. JGM49]|uniref:hypothetical protein n=1 Tax=Pantoea sp. JGM49 TaxID=2799791 RepID=UPI001BAA6B62|nr:hypothetical protein [Pantoea sp. JGM49]MBS0883486.1 hypothetical protein [Pantoea sp. JGM49]